MYDLMNTKHKRVERKYYLCQHFNHKNPILYVYASNSSIHVANTQAATGTHKTTLMETLTSLSGRNQFARIASETGRLE
jgi:hypothetical protein